MKVKTHVKAGHGAGHGGCIQNAEAPVQRWFVQRQEC
jgi:hypothetical protein